MSDIPTLPALFLRRFIPVATALILGLLFLYYVDVKMHKPFAEQIGATLNSADLNRFHDHLLETRLPMGVILFVAAAWICALLAIRNRQQLISDYKLQEQLYKVQLLLDSTKEGIYATDHDGNCTMANRACLQMLGYNSFEQIEGMNMHLLMHHTRPDGSPYPESECSAHRMSETGVENTIENELFWRKDGSYFPVAYSVLPMKAGQNTVGMVCSFIDMTERLQIEEKLRQLQKLEAIGNLSGGIAHDFNNILQVIASNTHLVMEQYKEADPLWQSLKDMLDAVDRGVIVTSSMLAFSGKQFVRMKKIDLNQLVAEAVATGCKQLPDDIQLELSPCDKQLMINGDPILLRQSLLNLIRNSSDAMPQGGIIKLTVSTDDIPDPEFSVHHNLSGDKNFACLTVADQGSGIPAELQQMVFDPFFTTKDVGQGSGLGLSMAIGTVQQHGGTVLIRDTSKTGTTMAIYLPLS